MSHSGTRALTFALGLVVMMWAAGMVFGVRTVSVSPVETGSVALNSALRTVVVAVNEREIPSQPNGPLRASLLAGNLPDGVQQATVLTDSNCTPDAEGISHCINVLKMGRQQISLRHNHNMAEVPCLSPGEEVNVVPLALLNVTQE
jgi:hypothetical protein